MTARPANAHQARLLRLLRDDGPNSRAQLGDRIDLSRSKLAVEVDRLLETGLVVADGLAASRGGRRSHNIRLAPALRFLGVDIGATSVDVAVTNAELEVLGHINQPMDVREGPVAVFEQVLAMAAKLRASGLAEGFDGAGVGVPGPVRFPEGIPVAPPIMPGWDGFPVREALSQDLGCPVMVDNDVNLMAMGEQHAGVARSVGDFLCVKIGTGIGCGIVVGGEVHRGVTGSAGDIGHIQAVPDGRPCACGNRGCLEAHFSGAALARDAGRTDADVDDRAQVLRADIRTAGVTYAGLTLELALSFHYAVREAHDEVDAAISRLHAATGGGDYAYYSDIAHFMAGLPLEAASRARWFDGQQPTRQRWRTLVTTRRDQLHVPR